MKTQNPQKTDAAMPEIVSADAESLREWRRLANKHARGVYGSRVVTWLSFRGPFVRTGIASISDELSVTGLALPTANDQVFNSLRWLQKGGFVSFEKVKTATWLIVLTMPKGDS